MNISINDGDLQQFENEFFLKYNVPLNLFFKKFNLPSAAIVDDWVPSALRDIADFVETQRKQKCSNCGSTNHEPYTLITSIPNKTIDLLICKECNALFAKGS